MPPIRLDHFITYTSALSIDEQLEWYRQAGFGVLEETVRHEPGLRNGFVGFGREYIEFCWVEDEEAFAVVGPQEQALRAACRPYCIGLATPDVAALHVQWAAQGYELSPVVSRAPRDAAPDADPVWSFQEIPPALQPGGAESFVLTYHHRRGLDVLRIAANTTYAIAGVVFVTSHPAERAYAWGRLLAPDEPLQDDGEICSVRLGPHVGSWMTPARYEQIYGRHWEPSPHGVGEFAALHLLAERLETAEGMLGEAGGSVTRLKESAGTPAPLFVAPDPSDGFAFVLTERPASEWLAERTAQFGDPFSW
jgi:Glyoxalase-like domain